MTDFVVHTRIRNWSSITTPTPHPLNGNAIIILWPQFSCDIPIECRSILNNMGYGTVYMHAWHERVWRCIVHNMQEPHIQCMCDVHLNWRLRRNAYLGKLQNVLLTIACGTRFFAAAAAVAVAMSTTIWLAHKFNNILHRPDFNGAECTHTQKAI